MRSDARSRFLVTALGRLREGILRESAAAIEDGLGIPVDILPAVPEPAEAFDPVRRQFGAPAFLQELLRHVPPSGKLIGLTELDLFIPMLTFLFGHAQVNGAVAVLSLARLRPEFYGLPPDPPLLAQRLRKELLHESGHTFGLTHCSNRNCVMSLCPTIQQVDARLDEYCPGCRRALDKRLAGFRRSADEVPVANSGS